MLPHSPIISDEAKINNETGQVYKGFPTCTLFNHFVGFNPYFLFIYSLTNLNLFLILKSRNFHIFGKSNRSKLYFSRGQYKQLDTSFKKYIVFNFYVFFVKRYSFE